MRRKKLFMVLFAAYILILLKITVFRAGFSWLGGTWNLEPFTALIQLWRQSAWRFIYLFGGNIVWFVPFGFFLRIFTKIHWVWIAVLGALFSCSIELLQYVFGTGISELDDLILNSAGTAAGIFAGWCFEKYCTLKRKMHHK